MITQELLDFVKNQQASGTTDEQIANMLTSQGGWTVEQVNEAFSHLATHEHTVAPLTQEQVLEEVQPVEAPLPRPAAVKHFEIVSYSSILLVISSFALPLFSGDLYGVNVLEILPYILIFTTVPAFFIYMIARRQSNIFRIIFTLFSAFSLFSSVPSLFFQLMDFSLSSLITLVAVALNVTALYLLYRPESNKWFSSTVIPMITTVDKQTGLSITTNGYWSKIIPWLNITSFLVTVGLILGVDVPILISEPSLAPFFFAMLAVLAVSMLFYTFENFTLKKRYERSVASRQDATFLAIIIIRNIIFVLNCIPYIQLLGFAGIFFCSIPFVVIYAVLIIKRNVIARAHALEHATAT